MKIPKKLYEVLPVIWVVGGIYAIVNIESFMSFISGILLAGTGVVIMCYRNCNRKNKK